MQEVQEAGDGGGEEPPDTQPGEEGGLVEHSMV